MKKTLKYILVIGALLVAHPHDFFAQNFVHPGGLVTLKDIDRIKYLKDLEGDPVITEAFNKLKANGHALYTNTPNPTTTVNRGSTADNYSVAYHQAAAAFQNALMWRITGDNRHADCAVNILNAWAKTCKGFEGNSNASLASGLYGYEFAQAGELLRGYSGWKAADFKAYQTWMRDIWAPRALYFLYLRHGNTVENGKAIHYWSNWGLCNALCVISVGLLCDDVALYNEGMSHYKTDKAGNYTDVYSNPIVGMGNAEFLGNLVVWLQPDARGPYGFIGQMQESGRDQGHATMAAGLAIDICQTAWNQGEDLYGYMNNRIAAGIEYIALLNSLQPKTPPTDTVRYVQEIRDSVPFLPYQSETWVMTENGIGSMGSTRPCWDRVLGHYEGEMGVKMTYSRKMALKAGIDGGGGDYGPNSGGFDHLGFTTLTNYRPSSWYPVAGHFPVTMGTSITYKGKTYKTSNMSGIAKDSIITLSPSLPDGTAADGTWRWQSGETTRELTFPANKSGLNRVTYTSANGTKSTQAFSFAVSGDCMPDKITPQITMGVTNYTDTVITVLPFQAFSLSISTPYFNVGTAKWNTGATGFSAAISYGVSKDSTFWVDHINMGGYKKRINFHVKVLYITPSISVNGGAPVSTSNVTVLPGQSVELKSETTLGFDGGTFRWSTGHASKSLMVLNVQKAKHIKVYYTLVKNNVTHIDSLDFNISVEQKNYQLANGNYYIQNATDGTYLTNTNANANATDKIKPTFNVINSGDTQSQMWTITKETAANAGGRFKIVSKKDGNYVNENCAFGTNPYYSDWNTYTFHCLDGENLYAIQNGGKSGTQFWVINGNEVTGKGSATQNGYPFRITSVLPQPEDTTRIPGVGVISYIAPAYAISGGTTQRGDTISILQGKNLILKPVKVAGISGGTWVWDDNSTGSTLTLNDVQNSGSVSVTFTCPEGDTVYVFKLTYVIKVTPFTGIDNVSSASAMVYPNPVDDHLILKVSENINSNSTFGLYTIDGRKVRSIICQPGENKIIATDLPSGLYIGVFNEGGDCQTFKVLKK